MNPIRTKCYKIVAKRKGKLQSLTPELVGTKHCLTYVPGKLTKPVVGKIFTFHKLEDARMFNRYYNNEIWEAQGYGASRSRTRLRTFRLNLIESFWMEVGGTDFAEISVPIGTLFCKSIKLIKQIE